jgi:hypothetical protein
VKTMAAARLTKGEQTKLTSSEQLIWYYRNFPVIAAKELVDVDLIWLQRAMLNDMFFKNYVMLVLGRGVGKTWMLALFAVLYAMLWPMTKIGVIAPVFRQAGYVFDYIEEFYDKSPYIRAAVRKSSARGKGLHRTYQKELVRFNNGSFVEALPLGDGNKVRGRRYNVLLPDEYAQLDEEIVKLVLRPMLNVMVGGRRNKIVISSSAYYPFNHLYVQFLLFNVMQQREPDEYAVHNYNYLDVLRIPDAPFQIDEKFIRVQKADMTEETFAMENLAIFPIETKGFFPARLIEKCSSKRDGGLEVELENHEAEYVMGVDSARIAGGDNFAIAMVKMQGGMNRGQVYSKAMNGVTYQEMLAEIRMTLFRFPGTRRMMMDPAGGGTTFKDLLTETWRHPLTGDVALPILDMDDKDIPPETYGLRILRMVPFTQPTVNHMYSSLKADMEHARFSFALDVRRHPDSRLERAGWDLIATKQELMLLQAEPMGNFFKFVAPQGKKKDRATALALANMGVNELLLVPQEAREPMGVGFWV